MCTPNALFGPDQESCTDMLSSVVPNSHGYNTTIQVGKGTNAVCKQQEGPYYDMFGWLLAPDVTHEGSKMADGKRCDVYHLSLDVPGVGGYNFSACIAEDGVPREMNVSSDLAYKAMSSQVYRFSNVVAQAVSDEVFAPFEVCEERWPMPPCPGGTVERLDIYRVRSAQEPNSLLGRNAGDALGDMAFFCSVGGMDESQLVTHWSVVANSSWGQYAYCLYSGGENVCFGSSGAQVGRESSMGLHGASQGQCTANAAVGSWFSFPPEGACGEGTEVGDGCTWKAAPLRTVSAGCILNDRGLKAACDQERGHAPMSKSAEIFARALSSDDPALGGCPDADVALPQDIVV